MAKSGVFGACSMAIGPRKPTPGMDVPVAAKTDRGHETGIF
ncbi:hypothetical protein [Dyadobacter sp. SG02]|nr:hypothetical protein [Dyadobacter sp. SG02]